MFGPNKRVVNEYLTSLVNKDGRVLVLDTSTLGSASAMSQRLHKKNIYVFGTDDNLVSACKNFGVPSVYGWSKDILPEVRERGISFDLIFLDYCGTPDGCKSFNPLEDMKIASEILKHAGILAVTFCKRTPSLLSKCVNLCPPNMNIQQVFEYCDTSAMALIVYSSRKVPPIGPKIGSLVRVEKWVARVEQLFLDGVMLTHMKKSKGKYIPAAKHKKWEEPFSALTPF